MTLPDCTLAVLRRRRTLPSARRAAALDALIVLTLPNDAAFLRRLPEPGRWQGLERRDPPAALSSRSTTLANERQTYAALAYAKPGASSFERLGLAGRVLRELAVRKPGVIGVLVNDALGDAAHSSPDVALVGKGILFDTGGINLKPHRSMLDMHTDMAGSAVALAPVALAELGSPLKRRCLARHHREQHRPDRLPAAGSGARKQWHHDPGDPHRRRGPHGAGRHAGAGGAHAAAADHRLRDAHRRLRLCADRALQRRVHQPRAAGAALVAAGASSGERVWNFPLDEDFDSDLESPTADIMQCASTARAITSWRRVS
jgi:hypothetical protein